MNGSEIFKNLCIFRESNQERGISPAELKKLGIRMEDLPTNSNDEISRTLYYGDDGYNVLEVYVSYDHSRTFELKPDTNHFYLTLFDTSNNEIQRKTFMTIDDM